VLPGKTYSPGDIAGILFRRAWLILVTLGLGTAVAIAVSNRLPDQFRSETLIMLIPQRISETYVKGAVTTRIEDRLNSLENQILSRSRLERIILDLNLYQELRGTLPMEEVVRRMGDNDIVIRIEGKESFRVSYVSHDAMTAQATTARLASLFIEENRSDREMLAEDTNQFLSAQLADAKSRLVEQEKKLEEYRSRYGGELPSQVTANLQAIQNEQMRLQNLAESADRARERRLNIERQIADLQSSDPLPAAPSQAAMASPNDLSGESTAQQLQVAQARLQNLLLRAKPDHPDVRVMQRTVRDLEARFEAESSRSGTASGAVTERSTLPAERLRQQKLRDLQLQLDDIDRQLAEKEAQDRQIRAVVRDYQAKLDAAPKRESELIELTRDYATVQATYQNLLVKREEATLAANLERRNIGEQFKILDPAKVPERPFSPNRLVINLGGAGGGLALGLLLITLLEYRDSSFKCEDDVIRLLDMPVLAVVPLMMSDPERRTRKWRVVLIGAAVILLVGSGAALVVWRLQL
jgi:polysaccharide chain length determinant protein (PEP-CTERM system associated)